MSIKFASEFGLLKKNSENWIFVLDPKQSTWGSNDEIFCALLKVS